MITTLTRHDKRGDRLRRSGQVPDYRLRAKLFLLLVSSAVSSILLMEGGLHLSGALQRFPPAYVGEYKNLPSNNFVVDEATGWKMRPNHQFSWNINEFKSTYRSNAQGFRADSDFDPSEVRKKIILVGDSFTFATGVQHRETYGAIIESELPGSIVYNLAMPGFGVDQMWLSVRHQALPLRPDLVVVGLCDADFKRSQSAYRQAEGFNKPTFKLVDGRLVPKTANDRSNLMVRFLERHSRIWTAGRLVYRRLAYDIPLGEWWFLNEKILDAMRADARKNRTPLLLVYIPTQAWRRFPTLQSYMDRVGAKYINLRYGLPSPPQGIYFPREGHLNAKGHRYVANEILTWIRKNMPQLERLRRTRSE